MAAQDFTTRVLARKPKYDYRNFRLADYITPAMRAEALKITARIWTLDFISDQGDTPHCVGFGWLNYGNCEPIDDNWLNERGHELYYQAKIFDGEPNAENGSSTLSGVKSFMTFGTLQNNAYAFASSIEDVKVWVLANSPVVVGTNWYYDMFFPDSSGLVHIGGGIAGGHEYMIVGYDRETDLFLCANSWGPTFGINGFFFISAADFARLMREEGDACTAVEVAVVPPPPPPPDPNPNPGCLPLAGLFYKLYQWAGGK